LGFAKTRALGLSDNDSGFSSCIVCKTYQPLASAINAIEQQAIVAPC